MQNRENPIKYKIVLSKDALQDIKDYKKYILENFRYREYAENFSKKIKAAVIRVLKDRMYWQSIINRMKKIER